ncbi:MAG: hypothetical protein KJ634_08860 [Gammaproteobacteria bacterium]|nr:hypothetical protein [Gammaproteobacteria bacterium]MBU1415716.1 hypothetical protein [Gammaproteobacteria bacterium]
MSTRSPSIFLLSLLMPALCHAAEATWSLDTKLLHHGVDEFSQSGTKLVEESGWGPAIALTRRLPVGPGQWRATIELADHTLDYDGRSQSGIPVRSTTDYQRIRVATGYNHPVSEETKLGAQFEIESLDREINGVDNIAGLSEKTLSRCLVLGLETTIDRVDLTLDAVVGLSGSQKVSSPGIIDEVALPEGDMLGFRIGAALPLGRLAEDGLKWSATSALEYLRIDRSESRPWYQNGVQRGILTQPETRRWSLGFGLVTKW